jgi:hypothetical protein
MAIAVLGIDVSLSHPSHLGLRELRDRYAPEHKADFSEIS